MASTFLFDLDGTLLPEDTEKFFGLYFGALTEYFRGQYDHQELKKVIMAGTMAMIQNPGQKTNEEVFWALATQMMALDRAKAVPEFMEFYKTAYGAAKEATWVNPLTARCVNKLKARGATLVVATNPVFPKVATLRRIRWAGLDPEDFDLITTYEDFCASKPNPAYYLEILKKLGKDASDAVMVGNDNQEDMVAERAGLKGYLITDCLINRGGAPIDCHWQGSFNQFMELVNRGEV